MNNTDRVLSLLSEGPLTRSEVERRLGLSSVEAHNALSRCTRRQTARNVAGGRGNIATYAITPAGMAEVAGRGVPAVLRVNHTQAVKELRAHRGAQAAFDRHMFVTKGWPTVPPADEADRILARACNGAGGFSRFSERPLGVEPRTGRPKWSCCLPLVRGEAA